MYTGAGGTAAGAGLTKAMPTATLQSRVIADEVIVRFVNFSPAWRYSDSATMRDSIRLCQFYLLFLPSQAPNGHWSSVETWHEK
jgi:hypothetical protein